MYVIFPAEELINLSLGLSPEGQELIPFKRGGSMASSLRDLSHPALNDALKAHNELTFKLVRTVSEFTGQLGQCHEGHAEQLQRLVENFRKKNAELRKERPACTSSVFAAWEALLAEVEVDSQAHADVASTLGRQVSRPLIERSFFRKIQSRKVFTHRESLDTILSKTEEMLAKCRQEYKAAYLACISSPGGGALGAYLDAHNAYVQQLRATNAMLDTYNQDTLPQLLQELEEVYTDLCATLADSVLQGAEIISTKAGDQGRRYAGLCSVCRAVSGSQDVALLARALATPACSSPQRLHNFNPPKPPQQPTPEDGSEPPPPPPPANLPPALRDELSTDRASSIHPVRPRLEALRREATDLEAQTRNLSDSLETLLRMQQRSIEANLYNKANELQEDISLKRFDLRVAQIHLAAVRAQKELFSAKAEGAGTDQSAAASKENRERKMSSSSSGSMKSKWLSAFKSLKSGGQSSNQQQQDNVPPSTAATSPGTAVGVSNIASVQAATAASVSAGSKKNQMYHAVSVIMSMRKKQTETAAVGPVESGAHLFQEYTYKKITPCDICSQVLRGHSRQGVKCRLCKMNAHADCAEKAPRCQTKSRLLRRQKSTSEIETRPAVTEAAAPIDEERSEDELEPLNEQPEQPQEQPQQQRPRRTHRNHVSEVDATYEVLRQAGELGGSRRSTPPAQQADSGGSSAGSSATSLRGRPSRAACPPPSVNPSNSAAAAVAAMAAMSELHESAETSTRQRRRLFAGMKSFSVLHHSSAVHHGGTTGHAHSRSISLPETPGLPASASCNNNFGAAAINYSSSSAIVCPECWPPSVPRQRAPTTAPHSPRRHKLNLRMKSLSLDSPESSEHAAAAQRRARGLQPSSATAIGGGGSSGGSNSSHLQSPSSPVHNRRLLSARNMRMSSVELPDDNEKSLSSASTSPCPSPKPHRLLPTNLYVVLYNFKSRHPDELDLRAGYKLTVIDSSDADWWRGKCLGRVGYFPSKYVLRLQPGERPLQVTHNLQLADQENGLTLLRDQIVVQVGEELDGMVMIRSGDNRQAACPLSFLQEV